MQIQLRFEINIVKFDNRHFLILKITEILFFSNYEIRLNLGWVGVGLGLDGGWAGVGWGFGLVWGWAGLGPGSIEI